MSWLNAGSFFLDIFERNVLIMIKTYVRKTEPVQAIQWTGDNLEEIRRFTGYNKRADRALSTDRLYRSL